LRKERLNTCVSTYRGGRGLQQATHKAGYLRELLATNPDIDEGLRSRLRQCRETVVRLGKTESALIRSLQHDRLPAESVERLMSIPAQLLRAVRCRKEFQQHSATHAVLEAAQQT
jgi:hypothetical protein